MAQHHSPLDTITAAGSTRVNVFELPNESWMKDALCAQTDPEAFFPRKGQQSRDAKQLCASCPVTGECLQYALDHQERFGIWGGTSERERRKLEKSGGAS